MVKSNIIYFLLKYEVNLKLKSFDENDLYNLLVNEGYK
jgi:hypothetical protein